jgi:hypothetical protein
MLVNLMSFFLRYDTIAIPDVKDYPRDFMAILDKSSITYSVIYQNVDEFIFYIIKKL